MALEVSLYMWIASHHDDILAQGGEIEGLIIKEIIGG
jgi:hypothetical protein